MAANKRKVQELRDLYPEMTSAEMAERLGCRPAYIRATLSRLRAEERNPDRERGNPGAPTSWTDAECATLLFKKDVEHKTFRVIAVEMNRSQGSCAGKYSWLKAPKVNSPLIDRDKVSAELFADASRRCCAERTLTALLCGDPPETQSALYKKRAVFA